MNDPNQVALDALRQAVGLAPENIALADHLAKTLLQMSRPEEAAQVYRDALHHHPGNTPLQLGLADSYRRANRLSHALAILETLVAEKKPPAEALLLHARVLHGQGETRSAINQYKDAIDANPDLSDAAFESLLGLNFESESDDFAERTPASWMEDAPESGFDQQDMDDDDSFADLETPSIKFDDVGGMTEVKEDIRVKIIYPLQHAEMFAAYGKKVGGGILMYGPPGCGKTMLARATAGEIEAGFLSVGISDVLDMWVGNSEKNLHNLFQQARRNRPCVVFFDEVDALGASRSDMRRSSGRHLINQFLSELDGVETDNDGVLFLAATNAPWHLDSAFRRPGRFDRIVFVPPPDAEARIEILKLALAGKPTEKINLEKLAAKTVDFSGADLNSVVDTAVETKLKDAVKTGLPKPITTSDLMTAVKRCRPSTGEWFSTARNHALYSNEGGAYDPILDYLKIKR
ncbi:ATP-dependent zinc metalloprotease FtsH [Stieleria neptunia]|uniref:ATP-dependent zinc metalloprotease FtsH n=1 Tax=Stieleria neptunia TaxID=2527979 RepID=A0A518HZN8_9BACT|nr:ATP-binding protein [Stieleria neptunia]QDV46316.1 ATP-dependent zinc metalloprotease FtsH [Stieleria neptunia]